MAWKLRPPTATTFCIDTEKGSIHCSCGGLPKMEEWEAIARLMASAPDLQAELSLIVEGWDAIESNKIRKLSDWELARREFARNVLTAAQVNG